MSGEGFFKDIPGRHDVATTRAAALLVVAVVLLPGGASQADGRARALAPVQVALDAAADVLALSIRDIEPTGGAAAARARADLLAAYAQPTQHDFAPAPGAAYGKAVVDALPLILLASDAVDPLPDALTLLALSAERCGGEPAEARRAVHDHALARSIVDARFASIDDLLADVPAGLDPLPLAGALADARAWSAARVCAHGSGDEAAFLVVGFTPARQHPGGRVTLHAASNVQVDHADVAIPGLALSSAVAGALGSFAWTFAIPVDAPLGVYPAEVAVGDLHESATLAVTPASTYLRIEGPATARVGANLTLSVLLSSAIPGEVDRARVELAVDVRDAAGFRPPGGDRGPSAPRSVALEGGAAKFTLVGPPVGQDVRVTASFPGSALAEPALATHQVSFIVPAAARGSAVADEGIPLIVLVGAGALLAALLASGLWLRRKTAAAAAEGGSGDRREARVPLAVPTGLVSLFGSLVAFVRQREGAPAGTTAREATARLPVGRAPAAVLLPAFERARYAVRSPPPSDEDAQTWAQAWWEKLTGGARE